MVKWISRLFIVIAIMLFAINFYGFTQTLQPDGLTPDVLRFKENDLKLTTEEFKAQVNKLPGEADDEYLTRLTTVIADGIAHVHWEKFDPDTFHQRVPIWENFLLYFMGIASNIPEFERYHFTIPKKSIERGIGLCGDASMLMSETLKDMGIENTIITVPGHVMVQTNINGKKRLLDPDFGVALSEGAEYYKSYPDELVSAYEDAGYFNNGELLIRRGFANSGYKEWQGAEHFVTKKYYFERVSYILKWLIPVSLLLLGFWGLKRKN